jgi:hypothetical protein
MVVLSPKKVAAMVFIVNRLALSLILISAGYTPDGPGEDRERVAMQRMLGAVQDALFRAEPDLK